MKDYNLLIPYEEAKKGHVFKQDRKYGLETDDYIWALPPKFDQIEICSDFIYAHADGYRIHISEGCYSVAPDDHDDLRFYANGHIGLKAEDGSVLLPAVYDEIDDWGHDCDVVYVRRGSEFHYYNHKKKEILTADVGVDDCVKHNYPYFIDEDARDTVMVVEPSPTSKGDNVCYAFNQWVKLTGLSHSYIGELFDTCRIHSIDQKVISHFYDDMTYQYSARKCVVSGYGALVSCVRKLNTLGCYDSSWEYLIKISTNRNSLISSEQLYVLMSLFEDMEYCIKFDIALDIDDSLADGEVEMFQVHYYWEGMYGYEQDDTMKRLLANGSLDDIEDYVNKGDEFILLADAYWGIDCNTARPLSETIKILNYLKLKGRTSPTALIRNAVINPFSLSDYTDQYWENKKGIVSWAVKNGGYLNSIWQGKTIYDELMEDLKQVGNKVDAESLQPLEDFLSFLRSIGAKTAKEERKYRKERLSKLYLDQLLDFIDRCQTRLYY